ncbi:hypothetical protein HYALB_00007018 [Hymenoscyphus albidus]|uniref:Uncharacterized protein n=1 Tax=Hymenoscyphus albidus TaxID=595503 RepID=A0A9N9LPB6_9HELO|nr:hypothetical protein HYALB_00007018 [Hymenoscyphus albidus]
MADRAAAQNMKSVALVSYTQSFSLVHARSTKPTFCMIKLHRHYSSIISQPANQPTSQPANQPTSQPTNKNQAAEAVKDKDKDKTDRGPHSTAQHSTAQHSTAQHSTAQHSTAAPQHSGISTPLSIVATPLATPSFQSLPTHTTHTHSHHTAEKTKAHLATCRPLSEFPIVGKTLEHPSWSMRGVVEVVDVHHWDHYLLAYLPVYLACLPVCLPACLQMHGGALRICTPRLAEPISLVLAGGQDGTRGSVASLSIHTRGTPPQLEF